MYICTMEVMGTPAAIFGMRNPMNSWDKADSSFIVEVSDSRDVWRDSGFEIGSDDLDLAMRLVKAGPEHRKFLRMIHVQADVSMPRYWWQEFDTYKVGTVANSCSTIHRLLNSRIAICRDMFVSDESTVDILDVVIDKLEELRQEYLKTKNKDLLVTAKRLLPESLLQRRMIDLNYETIRTIYHQRKNHVLKEEWVNTFCKWAESLPYAKEFITDQE